MNIQIRNETAADIQAIEAVTTAAFRHAPHTSHTEQFIVSALRRAGQLTISLIADIEGTVIGQVTVSPVTISDKSSGWFGLGPISVMPSHQRRGVGSHLMREVLRILRERGAAGCTVLGDPQFYSRFGFQVDPNLILPGAPPPYFQSVRFGSSQPHGIVAYHAAFGEQQPEQL